MIRIISRIFFPLSILLSLFIISAPIRADVGISDEGIQGSLTLCLGYYCGNYNGPTYDTGVPRPGGGPGSFDAPLAPGSGHASPFYSSGNADINRAAYNAYRQGLRRDYEAKMRQYQAAHEKYIRREYQVGNAELQAVHKAMVAKFAAVLPKLDANLDFEIPRRVSNPLPQGMSEAVMNDRLDPVWESIEQGRTNPIQVAQALSDLQERYLLDFGSIPTEEQSEYEFLKRELEHSKLVDGDGLLNLKPEHIFRPQNRPLRTNPQSFVGKEIRRAINITNATQAQVNFNCEGGLGSAEACAQADEMLTGLTALEYMADSWAASLPDPTTDPAFTEFFDELTKAVEFVGGVGSGLVNGAVNTVDGLKTLVTEFPAVMKGLYTAVKEWPKTWEVIKTAVDREIDTLLYGSASESGEVLGRIGFEVISALAGPAAVAKLGSATKLVSKVSKVAAIERALDLGSTVANAGKWAGKTGAKAVKQFGEVAENTLKLTRRGISDGIVFTKIEATRFGRTMLESGLSKRLYTESIFANPRAETVTEFLRVLNRGNAPTSVKIELVESFNLGGIRHRVLDQDMIVYRWHNADSNAKQIASYVSPDLIEDPALARKLHALPDSNRTLYLDEYRIKKGTLVFEGEVAPQPKWGQPGGGRQIFIGSELDKLQDVLIPLRRISAGE